MKGFVLAGLMVGLLIAGKPAFSESQPAVAIVQHPLVLAASDSQSGRGAAPHSSTPLTSTPAVSPTVFLPAMFGPPGVISGYVYSGNVPLAGYPVHLMRMFTVQVHPQPYEIMSATTKADGRYDFAGAMPGQPTLLYRAEIYPSQRGGNAAIVASAWFTYSDAGENLTLDALDHGAVLQLDDPTNGANIQLPYTFRWTSNVKHVNEYWVVVETVPCCISYNAGASTSFVVPVPNANEWLLIEGSRNVYVAAWTSTGYVKSQSALIHFKKP